MLCISHLIYLYAWHKYTSQSVCLNTDFELAGQTRYTQKRVRKLEMRVKKGEKVRSAYYCVHPFPNFSYHLHAQLSVVPIYVECPA